MIVGWGWSFQQVLDAWCRAEALGFDAAYMGDDSFPHAFMEADYGLSCYDPWAVLPVIAHATSRMRIGTTVTPAGRRHPGLFAKMTSIVDEISQGRLIVGMGAGNAPAQQNSFGEPFRTGPERVKMLSEELAILHSLWTKDRTSFAGDYYQVNEGINFPKPVQAQGPEVLLGFKSTKHMPALVAKYAKRANMFAGDAQTAIGVRDAVVTECEKAGRDPSEVVISRCASIILNDDTSLDRGAFWNSERRSLAFRQIR
jgi:alkanesulfonate monooxygenase SsuD/methylene tetrahydromethanopterin reductase-like flavin-dependent oxidoreductase (luciferase family)